MDRGGALGFVTGFLKVAVACLFALLLASATMGAISLTELGDTEFWKACQSILFLLCFAAYLWIVLRAMAR